MRVVVATAPGLGHLLPAVPVAWAALSAGHQVLVATTGPSLAMAQHLGFAAVEVSGDGAAYAAYQRLAVREMDARPDEHELASAWGRFTGQGEVPGDTDELLLFLASCTVERTTRVLREWRADLVLYTTFLCAGQLAAARAGLPCVQVGIGLPHPDFGAMHERRPAPPAAVLDVCPPSLRPPDAAPDSWPLRFVACNGGGLLPDWLQPRPARPRVCVTWGSVLPESGMDRTLEAVLAALAPTGVEVVLATGSATGPGPAPAGVRRVGWVPLSALLPGCAALIHHGGSGTTFTACAQGVPQIVLPQVADQPLNADAVHRAGIGVALARTRPAAQEVREALDRTLDDPDIGRACARVRTEIAAMPGPGDLVPRLAGLTPGVGG
ncbi:nucleotide disphospho-sugar-binding domain-containing protein [Streptomyces sp. CRN 30]|uniref:nucleotide disphospho-sugar-binding domain-containing protein n=1 Tax=Streptomyces sp. CRN 30 TaxID=3075613 RepID=UPI002A832049|nr:nucleotide disphospho-sugar-binding domain-containing protein [Streptomyces sp. CRN 30]